MTDTRPLATVNGYQGLIGALKARKEELGMSDRDLEEIADLTAGHWSKIVAYIKTLGPISMGRCLRALGIELVVSENSSQTAKIRELYEQRDEAQVRKRAVLAIARTENAPWLFDRKRAREMGAKRWHGISQNKRARIARKAVRARWAKHRAMVAGLSH